MIRWKILRLSINSLLGVILFWSCSDEKTDSGQDIFFEFSERKEVFLGFSGLSSDYLQSLSWRNRSSGLIYNYVNHSFDSLFFENDSLIIKHGVQMEFDGHGSVPRFYSFFSMSDSILIFSGKELIIKSSLSSQTQKVHLKEFSIFDLENPFQNIAYSPFFSLECNYQDANSNRAYFFIQDSRNKIFDLVWYDISENEFQKVPLEIENEEINQMILEVDLGKTKMAPNLSPELFVHQDKVIITYPFKSEFLVYDIWKNDIQRISPKTFGFPERIEAPIEIKNEVSFNEALELIKNENMKGRFGSFSFLEEEEIFFRMIKGRSQGEVKNFDLYLEVFNQEFEKIGEQNLSDLNPDLDNRYFLVNDKIAFVAKDQPDEDVMYFYYLNIRRSK
ncbi:hypothetical protein Aoki45_38830 [Algoriphagus sp. oki45]|nr:hypothetical protein Aoki45_38830 [Algoriphagus sp. oki45]